MSERLSLSARARVVLEDDILSGRMKPGEAVDERAIAARLGMSRTPVREAIQQLGATDLIEIRPRQTALVKSLDPSVILELFEALIGLESLVAGLAARRISDNEVHALERLHRQSESLVAARDFRSFQQMNLAFHRSIYAASRNAWLATEANRLRSRVGPYREWLFQKVNRLSRSYEEHSGLIAAFRAGDEASASRLMREHEQIDSDRLFDFMLANRRGEPELSEQVS
ncbi:GntR family transcriptional regulator [Microbaculum marinum]|uniref:GntR family transcriptional regulator n=1 Tax=Microbaculum marinum TaxID=1764581 RepID=A0AAW9RSX3_9HYPH